MMSKNLLGVVALALATGLSPTLVVAQDQNPVGPLINIVGNLIQQKLQEEALKNSPDAIQPGGLTRAQVMIVQQKLIDQGYDVGGADGIIGPKTMAIVATLQRRVGQPITGYPTQQLMDALLQ
jgi:hypothetical protein